MRFTFHKPPCSPDLCLAVMAIKQRTALSHYYCIKRHSWGPVTFTCHAGEHLAMEPSLYFYRLRSVPVGIPTPNLPHDRWTLSNRTMGKTTAILFLSSLYQYLNVNCTWNLKSMWVINEIRWMVCCALLCINKIWPSYCQPIKLMMLHMFWASWKARYSLVLDLYVTVSFHIVLPSPSELTCMLINQYEIHISFL